VLDIAADEVLRATTDHQAPSHQAPAPITHHQSPSTRKLRVAANLPYYVASPILFKLVEWHARRATADAGEC